MLGGTPGRDTEKVSIVFLISEAAVARNLSAAELIRKPAELIGGGGGGSAEMAQAGGRDSSKLEEAFATARRMIEQVVG